MNPYNPNRRSLILAEGTVPAHVLETDLKLLVQSEIFALNSSPAYCILRYETKTAMLESSIQHCAALLARKFASCILDRTQISLRGFPYSFIHSLTLIASSIHSIIHEFIYLHLHQRSLYQNILHQLIIAINYKEAPWSVPTPKKLSYIPLEQGSPKYGPWAGCWLENLNLPNPFFTFKAKIA
jgi:hypothetical protein